MKKALTILFFVFSASCVFGQAGVATAANQTTQTAVLNDIKSGVTSVDGKITTTNSRLYSYSNQTAADLLQNISDALYSGTNTATLSVTSSTSASSGTISAGAKNIGITTSSDFTGTINGVTRSPNTFYSFGVNRPAAVLGAVSYSVTAGSIIIDKIQ